MDFTEFLFELIKIHFLKYLRGAESFPIVERDCYSNIMMLVVSIFSPNRTHGKQYTFPVDDEYMSHLVSSFDFLAFLTDLSFVVKKIFILVA